jgi:hypothetical protein
MNGPAYLPRTIQACAAAICVVLQLLAGRLPAAAQTAPNDPVASAYEMKLQTGTPEQRREAAAYFVNHPDATDPINLALVSARLWLGGDRAQAAFWFYIFQIRTRAWAKGDRQGHGALRASLNNDLGSVINGWVGSDLDAWHDIAARAIAYEKKIPLYPGKLERYSDSEWAEIIVKERADYESDLQANFPAKMPAVRAEYEEKRRKNGLPVGPLQDPGKPLPDNWR